MRFRSSRCNKGLSKATPYPKLRAHVAGTTHVVGTTSEEKSVSPSNVCLGAVAGVSETAGRVQLQALDCSELVVGAIFNNTIAHQAFTRPILNRDVNRMLKY